jgi:hypothetical protein
MLGYGMQINGISASASLVAHEGLSKGNNLQEVVADHKSAFFIYAILPVPFSRI